MLPYLNGKTLLCSYTSFAASAAGALKRAFDFRRIFVTFLDLAVVLGVSFAIRLIRLTLVIPALNGVSRIPVVKSPL